MFECTLRYVRLDTLSVCTSKADGMISRCVKKRMKYYFGCDHLQHEDLIRLPSCRGPTGDRDTVHIPSIWAYTRLCPESSDVGRCIVCRGITPPEARPVPNSFSSLSTTLTGYRTQSRRKGGKTVLVIWSSALQHNILTS